MLHFRRNFSGKLVNKSEHGRGGMGRLSSYGVRIAFKEQCIVYFSFSEFWILWERPNIQVDWHKTIIFMRPGLMTRLKYVVTMDFLTLHHRIGFTLLAAVMTKPASFYGSCSCTTYNMKVDCVCTFLKKGRERGWTYPFLYS